MPSFPLLQLLLNPIFLYHPFFASHFFSDMTQRIVCLGYERFKRITAGETKGQSIKTLIRQTAKASGYRQSLEQSRP
jgi:hypothetical protein